MNVYSVIYYACRGDVILWKGREEGEGKGGVGGCKTCNLMRMGKRSGTIVMISHVLGATRMRCIARSAGYNKRTLMFIKKAISTMATTISRIGGGTPYGVRRATIVSGPSRRVISVMRVFGGEWRLKLDGVRETVLFFSVSKAILDRIAGRMPRDTVRTVRGTQTRKRLLFVGANEAVYDVPARIEGFRFSKCLYNYKACLARRSRILLGDSVRGRENVRLLQGTGRYGLNIVTRKRRSYCFPKRVSQFSELRSAEECFTSEKVKVRRSLRDREFRCSGLFICMSSGDSFSSFHRCLKSSVRTLSHNKGTCRMVRGKFSGTATYRFVVRGCSVSTDRTCIFKSDDGSLTVFRCTRRTVTVNERSSMLSPCTRFIAGAIRGSKVTCTVGRCKLVWRGVRGEVYRWEWG